MKCPECKHVFVEKDIQAGLCPRCLVFFEIVAEKETESTMVAEERISEAKNSSKKKYVYDNEGVLREPPGDVYGTCINSAAGDTHHNHSAPTDAPNKKRLKSRTVKRVKKVTKKQKNITAREKPIYEIFKTIPVDVRDEVPRGLTSKQYWEANDEFLNGYDLGEDIILTHRCSFTGKKIKNTVRNFKWYAYVKKKDVEKIPQDVWKKMCDEYVRRVSEEGNYLKVFVHNESIVEHWDANYGKKDDKIHFRDFLEEYDVPFLECDISNMKRFCIDNKIKISGNYKYIFFDIETDDSIGGIEVGRDRILSFASVDQDGRKRFIILKEDTDEAEVVLLEKIWSHIEKYDVVIGWNSGNFDLPYIRERWYKLKDFRLSTRDIAHVDFMKRFQKVYNGNSEIRSFALDNISEYFLGDKKVKIGKSIRWLWENDRKTLKKYNLKDCMLLHQLEEKLGVFELVIKMCQWCGVFPKQFYISELLDNYILRYARSIGVHFPPTRFFDRGDENVNKVEGGFVLEPERGLHDNVYVLDFKSLYPTIMMTWNISPDTYRDKKPRGGNYIQTVNGYTMHNKPGILPNIVKHLLDERSKYKNIKADSEYGTREYKAADSAQNIVKELANSLYGIMAQRGGRYYKRQVAEAITLAGQFLIKTTKRLIEEDENLRVIYGDTDSVFVKSMVPGVNIRNLISRLQSGYDEILSSKFDVNRSYVELEYEKHFKKFLSLEKKRYIGHLIELDNKKVDDLLVKGIDYVRRDSIEYGRKLQRELADLIVRKNITFGECVEYVKKQKEIYLLGEFDKNEIVIRKRITKKPSDYAQVSPHVKIAQQLIDEKREFYVGMQIGYVVTQSKLSGSKTQMGVYVDDFDGTYDVEYYWDCQIYNLMKRLLVCAYPDYDWCEFEYEYKKMRAKKKEQYNRWLSDKKKDRELIIEKIKGDKWLSEKQKRILIFGKKKKGKTQKTIEESIKNG